MKEYSATYKTFSKSILHAHRSQVEEWTTSDNPELKEAARMVLDAGEK